MQGGQFDQPFGLSPEFLSCITVSQIAGSRDSRVPDVGNSAMALKRTGLAAKLSERSEVQHNREWH
jgi:hypothetical protein